MKRLDNTGHPIVADDEFLLIFGGLTYRNRSVPDIENLDENGNP
jgi:hypothetical protein